MCRSCMSHGRWLPNCSDRRGPRTSSPPAPPARLVPVGSYRAPTSLSRSDRTPTNLSRSDRTPTNLSRSGASTRSGISVHSAGTGNSRASRWSIDSADTVNSVHSLQSLANQISADLYPQERLVTQLGNWQRTLDPATYRRHVPWPPEVKAAYDEYKRLVHVFAQAREAFEEDRGRTATMPEEHLERARLAVAWGEAALRAAEGRLTFLDTYRNAYSGPESIKNHIKEGQNTINSGRRAVKEARTNYGSMGTLGTILAATNLDDNFRTLGKV